jgi:glycosyltransferase involved in cell wall biosynthesis
MALELGQTSVLSRPKLESEFSMSDSILKLSVIVPTFNRSALLERLLQALIAQTIGISDFEVVVVDDGSTDNTQAMLAEFSNRVPKGWLRVLRQQNSGPAAARNRAVQESKGQWIAMTDDDTVPCPDWLEQILVSIQKHPFWVGVEGRTVCPDPNPMGHWVENLRGGSYITANMAYRKDLLQLIGGFDASFPFPKCEDTEIAWRALQQGKIGFSPDMCILHPSRPQPWYLPLRQARYELSEFKLHQKMKSDYGRFRRFSNPWLMLLLIYFVVPLFKGWRFRRHFASHPKDAFLFSLVSLARPWWFLWAWIRSSR